eukprot:scaffold269_cov229-Pinguiococcus_pyrenoidosus.AAC.10
MMNQMGDRREDSSIDWDSEWKKVRACDAFPPCPRLRRVVMVVNVLRASGFSLHPPPPLR